MISTGPGDTLPAWVAKSPAVTAGVGSARSSLLAPATSDVRPAGRKESNEVLSPATRKMHSLNHFDDFQASGYPLVYDRLPSTLVVFMLLYVFNPHSCQTR